jgi:predicted nucleic acid-binding protein
VSASTPVVLDTTVLFYLAVAGRTDLPRRLWADAACTTPAALAEYHAGAAQGLAPRAAWEPLPLVQLTDAEAELAARFAPRLGPGERTCLAVAHSRHGLLASDDLDARMAAARHGVAVTGTVGILLRGVQQGLLARDEANHLLQVMIAAGFRSPVRSLDALLP